MTKRALITGIAGQDGLYLAELLLDKGYQVYGVPGPEPGGFLEWARPFGDRVRTLAADLTDIDSLLTAVRDSEPDEIYNLAARSSVGDSWTEALATSDVNATGVLRLLEAVRVAAPQARVFQASSAEMFGDAQECPQTESTPIRPRSPYAIAKAYAYHMVISYRDSHGLHASNGIMFNHESPRRGSRFVTGKIAEGAARIKLGLATELRLGNLDARRDWGFAGEYVGAMWLMLQQDEPGDYVVATGETHSVREFCEIAFAHVGLDYGDYVKVDPAFFRPVDTAVLCGEAAKAREQLGWRPKTGFRELVATMVDAAMSAV